MTPEKLLKFARLWEVVSKWRACSLSDAELQEALIRLRWRVAGEALFARLSRTQSEKEAVRAICWSMGIALDAE